jgi:hypothetical protein
MPYEIKFSHHGRTDFQTLQNEPSLAKRLKAVRKTLGLLEHNPRHPGLNTHKFTSKTGPNGEDVFEAYAENNTPGAYRIFWIYGPGKDVITIVAITAHP